MDLISPLNIYTSYTYAQQLQRRDARRKLIRNNLSTSVKSRARTHKMPRSEHEICARTDLGRRKRSLSPEWPTALEDEEFLLN